MVYKSNSANSGEHAGGNDSKNSLSHPGSFLDAFLDVCGPMVRITDPRELISFVVEKAAAVFNAGKVSYMALDEQRQELSVKASHGLSQQAKAATIKMGELFAGWVAKEKKPLLVKDIELEFPELAHQSSRTERYSTSSFLILPLELNSRVYGVFSLTDKTGNKEEFSDDDLKALTFIGQHLILCLENLRLTNINNSLATRDPLTGLFNHRSIHEQLIDEIYRAERYSSRLSLAIFDIDGFAAYNRDYGYSSGDSALSAVAMLIKENIRKTDLAARYGGEEFMVILPETNLKNAIVAAEKIRDKIAAAVFTDNRKSSYGISRITLSAGLAEHRPGLTKEELVGNALAALRQAKDKGKDRVCGYR